MVVCYSSKFDIVLPWLAIISRSTKVVGMMRCERGCGREVERSRRLEVWSLQESGLASDVCVKEVRSLQTSIRFGRKKVALYRAQF